MSMKPKFKFYEKVKIISTAPKAKKVYGELAAVLGHALDERNNWSYSVYIYRDGICWGFGEEELEPIGEFDKRESFFTGETIKVRVDEQGKGYTVSN